MTSGFALVPPVTFRSAFWLSIRAVAPVLLAGALLAAPPAWAAVTATATATKATESAARPSAPSAASVRVARSYGWLPLGPQRLVVWLGVEEPYLIRVGAGCTDLSLTVARGITSHRRRITAGLDHLLTQGGACRIETLERADPGRLRRDGLQRNLAQPLPVVPVAGPESRKSR